MSLMALTRSRTCCTCGGSDNTGGWCTHQRGRWVQDDFADRPCWIEKCEHNCCPNCTTDGKFSGSRFRSHWPMRFLSKQLRWPNPKTPMARMGPMLVALPWEAKQASVTMPRGVARKVTKGKRAGRATVGKRGSHRVLGQKTFLFLRLRWRLMAETRQAPRKEPMITVGSPS